MPFYWPSCSVLFWSPAVFPFSSFILWVGIAGLGLRTDRVIIALPVLHCQPFLIIHNITNNANRVTSPASFVVVQKPDNNCRLNEYLIHRDTYLIFGSLTKWTAIQVDTVRKNMLDIVRLTNKVETV